MAKFYGIIGFAESEETVPGVWTDGITERNYSGDVIRNVKRWNSGDKVNDDLTVNNEISILADMFAFGNFHNMKYVKWMGVYWKISSIDIQRPRIRLQLGGVYNGETS